MRFIVFERVRGEAATTNATEFAKLAEEDIDYKLKLQKDGKIASGGPCLDILADCYILQTETLEEMGDIFFNSPSNTSVEREVHPLGTYEDSKEGMREIRSTRKKR